MTDAERFSPVTILVGSRWRMMSTKSRQVSRSARIAMGHALRRQKRGRLSSFRSRRAKPQAILTPHIESASSALDRGLLGA